MMSGGGSPDPYYMTEYIWQPVGNQNQNAGYKDVDTKVPAAFIVNSPSPVIVTFGDSIGVNIVPTAYTPVNFNVLNFNIYNGAIYKAADPLLGASGPFPSTPHVLSGCMFTYLADYIQGTNLYISTLIANANIGGTLVSDWASDKFYRISGTFARLSHAGITPTAVLIQLGANDGQAHTSQAGYTSLQAQMIAQIRQYYQGPIVIAVESWISGASFAPVQNAQIAAVNNASNIYAGPDTDTLTNAYRQADQTHWNDAGAAACANLWLSSLTASGIL